MGFASDGGKKEEMSWKGSQRWVRNVVDVFVIRKDHGRRIPVSPLVPHRSFSFCLPRHHASKTNKRKNQFVSFAKLGTLRAMDDIGKGKVGRVREGVRK